MDQRPPWECKSLIVGQECPCLLRNPVKNVLAFYGTLSSITVSTCTKPFNSTHCKSSRHSTTFCNTLEYFSFKMRGFQRRRTTKMKDQPLSVVQLPIQSETTRNSLVCVTRIWVSRLTLYVKQMQIAEETRVVNCCSESEEFCWTKLSSAKVTEYAESVGDEINMNRKHWWKETDKGKEKYDKKKPVPIPHFPPQITNGLAWD